MAKDVAETTGLLGEVAHPGNYNKQCGKDSVFLNISSQM